MPILNFQIAPIAESGQLPKIIFIATDDLQSDVVGTGYLNRFVEQGNLINRNDMAQVSFKDSPYSALFNISFSGGNWSLVAI